MARRNVIYLNEVMGLDAEFVLNGKVHHVATRYESDIWGSDTDDVEEDLRRLRRNAAAMNRRYQKKIQTPGSRANRRNRHKGSK